MLSDFLFLDRCLNLTRLRFDLSLSESGDASDEKSSLETEDPRLGREKRENHSVPRRLFLSNPKLREKNVTSNKTLLRRSTGRRKKAFSIINIRPGIISSESQSHAINHSTRGQFELFIYTNSSSTPIRMRCHLSCTWGNKDELMRDKLKLRGIRNKLKGRTTSI